MRMPLHNAAVFSAILLVAGCNSSAPPVSAPVAIETDGHGHAHDHAHEALGPHGGHLVELGDAAYHIEWTHDDETGLVTMYVLDSQAKKLVPVPLETISVTAKVEQPTEYRLAAIDPSGDPPASATFQLKSPELLVGLQMAGRGSEVSVAVTVDGNEYRGEFEHHDHGHGHHH